MSRARDLAGIFNLDPLSGTTAERPATAEIGQIYYNGTTAKTQIYTATGWQDMASGIPFGNTAGRPSSPSIGQPYFNGELGYQEVYTNSGWKHLSGILSGNTAERPSNPAVGQLYSNGELQRLELYSGPTYGWQNIVAETPGVTGYTGTLKENSGGTITVTGTNFASGATTTLVGSGGTEYVATSTMVNNLTQISATFGPISGSEEPYDIKVTNPSNLYGVYYDILTVNDSPVWQTAAGSLGTFSELSNISVSVSATDEESDSIAYSLASGSSLPTGITLNSSTGVISGTLPDITSTTTYSFTINATSGQQTSSRLFTITSLRTIPVEYLIVAGGGAGGDYFQGGGYNAAGGGGGAGGYIYSSSSNLILNSVSISVGSAGVSTATSNTSGGYASNGGNSLFAGLTAIGGGKGASGNPSVSANAAPAGSGGSGGGGVRPDATNFNLAGGNTSGQGNIGGAYNSGDGDGGGGGGATAAGTLGGQGSQGGAGFTSSITGSSAVYAAGGGGGKGSSSQGGFSWSGSGGSGIGGSGGTKQNNSPGGNASSYGSGGGGAGSGADGNSVFSKGGNGSAGVVIIAYPDIYPIATISAGLTYDQPSRSGYRVYRFTAGSGTVTV